MRGRSSEHGHSDSEVPTPQKTSGIADACCKADHAGGQTEALVVDYHPHVVAPGRDFETATSKAVAAMP
jgi:hypothetical protein